MTGFEAITQFRAGLVETTAYRQVITDAQRRIAMIEVAGVPAGTGVLVGPDLLLTAAHVLGTDDPRLKRTSVTAVFDYHADSRSSPADSGTRIEVADYLDGTPMTSDEADRVQQGRAPSPQWLDFALLRLSRPAPGRGHYRLFSHEYAFANAGPMMIVQHPLGGFQKLSFIYAPARPDSSGNRVTYRANTQHGSSGGAVVDDKGRLVAVHHYSHGHQNQGTCVSAIAKALLDGPHATVVNGPVSAPPILLSWSPADEQHAQRIFDVLATRGYRVVRDLGEAPDRRAGVAAHLDEGGRVFALVTAAYLADQDCLADRDQIFGGDPRLAAQRFVSLLIDVEPVGIFALLPTVDLRDADPSRTQMLLDGAAFPPVLTDPVNPAAEAGSQIGFRPGDPLPRLQRLSERARRTAGTVPGTIFSGTEQDAFAAGLYVSRDLEGELDGRLRTAPEVPIIVVGEPGSGKTSILWGMARRLCADASAEVFFIKASWLVRDGAGVATVDEPHLSAAIQAAALAGGTVVLIIDTVDILVNNDESWDRLVAVVDSAAAARASVVVSCRVAEATELPPTWTRCSLGDYSIDEFGLAVAAHSRFFTQDPMQREDLVADMLRIVARDLPMKSLCLRPLTLRMLFEIYNPARVSEVVDTTSLYETYWDNRVLHDRRAWDTVAAEATTDRDLTAAAEMIALEMLRTGLPEVAIGSILLPEGMTRQQLHTDADLLIRRGVGQRTGNATFQFFHQTFFEYAASRALVRVPGGAGINALIDRIDGDDYFLLAVLEQTLLCAGRSRESAADAAGVLRGFLDTLAGDLDDGGSSLGYGLRQVILAVCALGPPVDDATASAIERIVGSPNLDLPSLRSYLALIPAPGRPFDDHDKQIVISAASRADNAWLAVLETLERLLPRDSPAAFAAVREGDFVGRAVHGHQELAHRGELRDFLVDLLLWNSQEALQLLRPMVEAALDKGRNEYVAQLLARMAVLAANHPETGDWTGWSDQLLDDVVTGSWHVSQSHALLLAPRLRAAGYPALVDAWDDLAQRLTSDDEPLTSDYSLLCAVLAVAGDMCPPDADPAAFIASFVRLTARRTVSNLSRGWLVPLMDSESPIGTAVRRLAAQWLAEGMPTTPAETISDTRAKIMRVVLADFDLPLDRVAEIAGPAAAVWSSAPETSGGARDPEGVWLDTNCLLDVVIRAAAANVSGAETALAVLARGGILRSPDLTALVEQFTGAATGREVALLVDLLLRIGEIHRTAVLLGRVGVLDRVTFEQLRSSAIAEFRATVPAERPDRMAHQIRKRLRDLARLLVCLDHQHEGLSLTWAELAGWTQCAFDPEASGQLVELVGAGLERGAYPPPEALELLRTLCDADSPEPWTVSPSPGRAARQWCVWWYANHGSMQDSAELLRIAFAEPVDAMAVIKASVFLLPNPLRSIPSQAFRIGYVLDVGRRVRDAGFGRAARNNIANAWRGAMWSIVQDSSESDLREVVLALPELDDPFAGILVQMVTPGRRPELLKALQDVASTPVIGTRLKRNVNEVLDRSLRHASVGGWPTIFADLQRAGANGSGDLPLPGHTSRPT